MTPNYPGLHCVDHSQFRSSCAECMSVRRLYDERVAGPAAHYSTARGPPGDDKAAAIVSGWRRLSDWELARRCEIALSKVMPGIVVRAQRRRFTRRSGKDRRHTKETP